MIFAEIPPGNIQNFLQATPPKNSHDVLSEMNIGIFVNPSTNFSRIFYDSIFSSDTSGNLLLILLGLL